MNKLPFVALSLLALSVGLAGCGTTASNAARIANADAEASGSPFRWTSKSVPGGSSENYQLTFWAEAAAVICVWRI